MKGWCSNCIGGNELLVSLKKRVASTVAVAQPQRYSTKAIHLEQQQPHMDVTAHHREKKEEKNVEYEHTLPSAFPRWTAKESFELMGNRAWHKVKEFYWEVVNNPRVSLYSVLLLSSSSSSSSTQWNPIEIGSGVLLLSSADNNNCLDCLEEEERSNKDRSDGRWARSTFKILLSYHGPSFHGWQRQPATPNTVQGLVESSLGTFVDDRKAQILKNNSKPLEAAITVAGRTDKGVSALHQVCSFYTWRNDVKPSHIQEAINNAAPRKLRVVSVSQVSREFHPNFSAKWRRYLYIFPLNDTSSQKCGSLKTGFGEHADEDDVSNVSLNKEDVLEGTKKPTRFSVARVDRLLRQLEGKLLSYKVFARDTKASRNIGPPTECFLYHARAVEARLPDSVYGEGIKVMAVELVGNRFLRKMVRVLVATSVREAAAGAEEDALIKLMDATCRRATAPPAPPDGLCLVDVGYTSFNPKICLIH